MLPEARSATLQHLRRRGRLHVEQLLKATAAPLQADQAHLVLHDAVPNPVEDVVVGVVHEQVAAALLGSGAATAQYSASTALSPSTSTMRSLVVAVSSAIGAERARRPSSISTRWSQTRSISLSR